VQQARRAASCGRRVFVPAHDAFRRGGDNPLMAAFPKKHLLRRLRQPQWRNGLGPDVRTGPRALIAG
jgi:hypothetical protein